MVANDHVSLILSIILSPLLMREVLSRGLPFQALSQPACPRAAAVASRRLIEWSGPNAALRFLAGMTGLTIILVGLL
jgi:hypothetical protein